MDGFLRNLVIRALHYASIVYTYARNAWNDYHYPRIASVTPHAQYFLSDSRPYDKTYLVVPEGAIYVEEWIDAGHKKSVVRYGGDAIPTEWTQTPFTRNAKTPWIWVGDRDTEIDLTRTFNRFLVVGNRITSQLVEKLIRVSDRTNLIYIESGTFKELKFPGEGLIIEEYVDQPVPDSREVH